MEKVTFSDLGLSSELLAAVNAKGFEVPTPIQALAIPALLAGKDVVGQAQTGTGKTAAFGLPILERIDSKERCLQALVLCPTRELAIQVAEEMLDLSSHRKDLNVLAVYGGQPIEHQLRVLSKSSVQIVVGTPGRVIDHIERGTIRLDRISMFALDEADEMLDMGFRDDIERVLEMVPATCQKIFFSATMPSEILELAKTYQRDPEFLKVQHKTLTVSNIAQFFVEIGPRQKFELLARLLDFHAPKLAIIFCNTKHMVDVLAEHLRRRGYFAAGLHGDLRQRQRDRVMEKFRDGSTEIVVATDVAARGLDVENVEMVINFDIPLDEEDYVHRIGRTGRAGRSGQAFTFVVGREAHQLRRIQNYTKHKIEPAVVPTLIDVEMRKLDAVLTSVREELAKGQLGTYTTAVEQLINVDGNVTSIDVAAALLRMMAMPKRPSSEELLASGGSDFERRGGGNDRRGGPRRRPAISSSGDFSDRPARRRPMGSSRGDFGNRAEGGRNDYRGSGEFRGRGSRDGFRGERGNRDDRGGDFGERGRGGSSY